MITNALRAMLAIGTLPWCAAFAAVAGTGTNAVTGPAASGADLVVVNGNILTMDPADTVVEAVAIRAGRIVAVGSNHDVRALAAHGAQIIDLHGRTATPGLIDSHAHLAQGGVGKLYSVELSDARDIAEVRKRIAARAATLQPGQWVLGEGWDEAKLADHRYIFAQDLDTAAPANPVWLLHTTGHYGAANSAALKLAHIDASTPNPASGTIDRDAHGQPTGVLKEPAAMEPLTRLIPESTADQIRNGILASVQEMHREGMTGGKDPDLSPTEWDAYELLDRDGKLPVHLCALWHGQTDPDGTKRLIAQLARVPKPPSVIHNNLMLCGVKFFMDGSGGARTAWMYDEWNRNGSDIDKGNAGYPVIEPTAYRESIRLLVAAGVHVGTHAIGDRAIDWVVDSYAQALKEHPVKGLRLAIIHANTPTAHALDVMQSLQRDYDSGYPETQAPFAWWIGDNYAGNLGAKRRPLLNPYQTYVQRGIHWGGGSDYPVTPLAARYGLWASVSRTTLRGTYGAQPFGTDQAVDIKTALKSYTVWAAHQMFLDEETGTLQVGKSADIAVWDRDLTRIDTAAIKDLRCELTLFRGRIVHRSSTTPITVTRSVKELKH